MNIEDNVAKIPIAGCWLWMGSLNPYGYGRVLNALRTVNGKRAHAQAHRVSYEQKHGALPAGMCVLHRCDVRCCVNPEHLFIGTRADNQIDMQRKDRGRWRLRPAERVEVLALREAGIPLRDVREAYGIGNTTLHRYKGHK